MQDARASRPRLIDMLLLSTRPCSLSKSLTFPWKIAGDDGIDFILILLSASLHMYTSVVLHISALSSDLLSLNGFSCSPTHATKQDHQALLQ